MSAARRKSGCGESDELNSMIFVGLVIRLNPSNLDQRGPHPGPQRLGLIAIKRSNIQGEVQEELPSQCEIGDRSGSSPVTADLQRFAPQGIELLREQLSKPIDSWR